MFLTPKERTITAEKLIFSEKTELLSPLPFIEKEVQKAVSTEGAVLCERILFKSTGRYDELIDGFVE